METTMTETILDLNADLTQDMKILSKLLDRLEQEEDTKDMNDLYELVDDAHTKIWDARELINEAYHLSIKIRNK